MNSIRGEKMKSFTVDFTGVKTDWQFYEVLIKGLEFPDWCGKNPDAIWDMLTGYMEYPNTIYLHRVNQLPKDLISEGELIIRILKRASEFYDDESFEIMIVS